MNLHFKTFGEGQPFIILHGLFGSSDNWQTHAKKLGEYFKVYAVDQRNHGESPWSDDFSYEIMAEDLHQLIEKEGLEDFILLGHSMGGKTAMTYTQKHSELVDKLIVVDMGVKSYPVHHDEIIEGLKSIDLEKTTSRREADNQLNKYIDEIAIRQFLLKNLYRKEKDRLVWRINLSVLDKKINEIVEAIPQKEVMVDTLFMRGGKSNYILEEDIEAIKSIFPISKIHTIESAGHWIHAEAPKEFIEEVIGFSLR